MNVSYVLILALFTWCFLIGTAVITSTSLLNISHPSSMQWTQFPQRLGSVVSGHPGFLESGFFLAAWDIALTRLSLHRFRRAFSRDLPCTPPWWFQHCVHRLPAPGGYPSNSRNGVQRRRRLGWLTFWNFRTKANWRCSYAVFSEIPLIDEPSSSGLCSGTSPMVSTNHCAALAKTIRWPVEQWHLLRSTRK